MKAGSEHLYTESGEDQDKMSRVMLCNVARWQRAGQSIQPIEPLLQSIATINLMLYPADVSAPRFHLICKSNAHLS